MIRYAAVLRHFQTWWSENGPALQWRITEADFATFERFLRTKVDERRGTVLMYSTRRTVLRRLREVFRWAFKRQYVTRDYSVWIPHAHGSSPKRKAAKVSSLQALMEAADLNPHGQPVRDKAILAMLMGMGLRRAEVSALNIENLHLDDDRSGYATVVGKKTKANPDGVRSAAWDVATGKYIADHLKREARARGPLFVGIRGERLTGQGIYRVVKGVIADAGLEAQISGPHDLRRAFATHFKRNRRNSGDLLRRQLGHAHYDMTDAYTLLDVDDIRRDIISPLALPPE